MKLEHIAPLVAALAQEFYADDETMKTSQVFETCDVSKVVWRRR